MSLNAVQDQGAKEGERARLFPAPMIGYSNGRSESQTDLEQPPASGGQPDSDADSESESDIWKAAVFGALDGVLTSFAVVAGASGGGLGTQAVLIVGVSSIVADGLSMGLGEYLSSKAMNEYMDIERKREEWELANHREGEVENMVDTYMRRGMSREDAQEVSARLAKYDDCFVDAVMVAEGVGSSMFASPPLDEAGSIREGIVTFGSFAISGIVPLLSYALSPLVSASGSSGNPVSQGVLFLWACLLTAAALFSIGVVKSTFVSRSWFGSGMETLVLGGCCAGLAYEIGRGWGGGGGGGGGGASAVFFSLGGLQGTKTCGG
ncbi:unnamed protein product [Ectocarpus sp. 4 AP-2014]